MKTIRILFTLLLAVLFFTACQKDETPNEKTTIQISGIEYSPNCFTKDGIIQGIDVDIASLAMSNTGIDMKMNIQESWEDAYNATLSGPNKALLTTAYTPERKDLFKWAGPTSQTSYCILSKEKAGIGETIGIEASKNIDAIAVVKNWLETTVLEDLGFTNLVYFDSYDQAIKSFKDDEIKAIASDVYQFISALSEDYYLQENIKVSAKYRNTFYYIAFSKDVDDAVIEKCQNEIEAMIKSGKTLSITQEYIQYATKTMIPGTLQLFSHLAAPLNYITEISGANVNVAGSSIDIVDEIQSRNTFTNPINMTSWVDAFSVLQYLPNSALFTTTRTTEREELFQWVGPISSVKACFYTLSNSGIEITTLDQAKALKSIATPQGWFTHEFLLSNNFKNIEATSTTPQAAFQQLIDGDVDALLMFDLGLKWLSDNYGLNNADITEQLKVIEEKAYIAFSLNTPSDIVEQWQTNLDAMKSDGTFETIWNEWYGDMEMP